MAYLAAGKVKQVTSQKAHTDLAEFFTKEHTKLKNYLRGKMQDFSEMEIEDVISDVFINLFNKADITGRIENLTAYIYRAAYNRIIDIYRRRKKNISLETNIEEDSQLRLGDLIVAPGDVDSEIAQLDIRSRLFQALDNLEPKQRAVWTATEIDGYTFRELADEWGEPIGTLLARKHRATNALQKALQDLYDEVNT